MQIFCAQVIYKFAQALRKLGVNFAEQNNPKIREMQTKIHQIEGIKFKIEYHPDGSWSAESINIDGIITGSKNIKDKNDLIKDAVFTYFGIPPHLCNDQLIRADNEPVIVTQKVYA